MWHASVMYHGRYTPPMIDRLSRALKALQSVGNRSLGQWVEDGRALHVRRRLSELEAQTFELRDIRNTPEAVARLDAVRHYLPAGYTE